MLEASQLKTGKAFLLTGKPYKVIKYFHQKIGRGGATVRLSVRNLIDGLLEEKTLNSSAKVQEILTTKKPLKYLYSDGENAIFIDEKSYEQLEISQEVLKDEIQFIKEGEIVNILFWEDRALSVDIPIKITFKVKETPPGVKGNSATNVYKSAILENGIKLKVPLFINAGDKVVVDTRTGEYVERAKEKVT